jgi:hypothetical protein
MIHAGAGSVHDAGYAFGQVTSLLLVLAVAANVVVNARATSSSGKT